MVGTVSCRVVVVAIGQGSPGTRREKALSQYPSKPGKFGGYTVAVIVSINDKSGLVLLEDGRELPITGYYASGVEGHPLTVNDALVSSDLVLTFDEADVFVVDIPGSGGAALIMETGAIKFARSTDIN